MSRQAEIDTSLHQHPEPTVALNPLTGLHVEDLVAVLATTLAQGVRQPLIMTKHLASHGRKLVDILSGKSDLAPNARDHRFQDEDWLSNPAYRQLLQAYLAFNETLGEWVEDLDLDDLDRLRADFLLRIVGDSVAPTNTLLGNPRALRRARETRGASVLKGVRNLVSDIRHNHGIPAQVKARGFEVGENLAITEGAVVFRNEVLELIQYTPSTERVHRRPLLIAFAMINKYYALDLTPERSFIKYCVDQGFQVFVMSWANPGPDHADWGIERYALAVMEAIEAVKSITRCKDLNLFSLCSGAMMTSAMAACLKARGDKSIHSMSIGVCMLEMEAQDNEFSAFSSPGMIERIKQRSRNAGILRGHELALSMLWLRPQELIWHNVVNNYLMGEEPPEFDLLYWNNDWTNLPSQLHLDLIDMFATGCLSKPGQLSLDGTPLDLELVDCDKFFVGGKTDHITPWKACYRSAHDFIGKAEFLLSDSGHMQTMLNAPGKRNASYFINSDMPESAQEWLDTAERQEGSWWPYWADWLKDRSLATKAAPKGLGNKHYPAGMAAPGSYIFQQSE